MADKTETPASQERRKVEIDDLYRFRLVSDPQVSPDGKAVAYVQTRLRKKENDYASNIWLVSCDGSSEPRKFTGGPKQDSMPRWSPTGNELAFKSNRSGTSQIWIIPMDGGEARQLTRMKRGVGEFAWSPDGKWIVFAHAVDNEEDKKREAERKSKGEGTAIQPDKASPPSNGSALPDLAGAVRPAGHWEEDEQPEDEPEEKGDHAITVTRLQYKADGEGLLRRRTHLFIVPSKGGKPTQVTDGDWDAMAVRWAPDGKSISFMANQEPDAEYRNIQDIFTLQIGEDGTKGDQKRVTKHDLSLFGYDWTPSGDGFVVFAHTRLDEGALATNPNVRRVSLDGGVTLLSQDFDRPAGAWISSDMRSTTGELRPRFSLDGSTVYFHATSEGTVGIYSVPLLGGGVQQVVGGPRQVLNFGVSKDGFAFTASTPTNPNDLYFAGLNGKNERRLTDVNADILPSLDLIHPREFWLDRPDGGRVQGWIMLPPGYRNGEKYPLVLQIHGGPHMSYGNVYFHEFQATAARGNMVMYTNPRGSQGYGQSFSDAILNDWGGIDYEDIMACVDHAIAQGNVDEKRLGVAGGSYGGYMSGWIIGHTQRFAAAVASRMVSNLYSAWGSGDVTWMLWNWEMEGMPQQRTDLYLERSPITYAPEIHTPLLITHAEDDQRTCIEQGEQMYIALKVLKREVKMVRFPSGGHEVSRSGKPSLRVERMQCIVDWFDQWLRGNK